jgi:hypothetical protein
MLRLVIFFVLCATQAFAQQLPPGVLKIVGIEAHKIKVLSDSTYYVENFDHRQIQNSSGITMLHFDHLGNLLDSISFRYPDSLGNFRNISSYGRPNPFFYSNKGLITSYGIQDENNLDIYRVNILKLNVFPKFDSIKSLVIPLITNDSTFLNCSASNYVQISDTSFLTYGVCQKLGTFNGHLELINWVALLDTNLNVLSQRMYDRTDLIHPLQLNLYNAIKSPDDGIIFGTHGRVVPDGIEPEFGGVTKLNSNLDVVWERIIPTAKVSNRLQLSRLFVFTLPKDTNHFYALQTYADTCLLPSHIWDCSGWENQLFNRRFLKFNWAGQLVSEKVDEVLLQAYMIRDVAVDEVSIVAVGNLTNWFFGGFIERYNHKFDQLWHVQPDAGMPDKDSSIIPYLGHYYLSNVALNGDKIIAGGKKWDPHLFPDPYQFAYITVVDSNGRYLDGTPIGYWLSTETPVKDYEVKVYPQPAVTQVFVEVPEAAGVQKVVLTDLSGRTVLQEALQPHRLKHGISIGHLPGGTYLLQLENESGVFYVTRLVVRP